MGKPVWRRHEVLVLAAERAAAGTRLFLGNAGGLQQLHVVTRNVRSQRLKFVEFEIRDAFSPQLATQVLQAWSDLTWRHFFFLSRNVRDTSLAACLECFSAISRLRIAAARK